MMPQSMSNPVMLSRLS